MRGGSRRATPTFSSKPPVPWGSGLHSTVFAVGCTARACVQSELLGIPCNRVGKLTTRLQAQVRWDVGV